MTALVLASEALRKFGGDSLSEVVRNRDGFVAAGFDPVGCGGHAGLGRLRRQRARAHARHRSRHGMTPRILLVGMMGAGKTTTGRLVAGRLGWDYRDSDAEVEAATGLTVPELFARDGEAAFRQAEADVLADACAAPAPIGRLRRRRCGAATRQPPPHRRVRHRGLAPGPARDAGRPGRATAPAAHCSATTRRRPWSASSAVRRPVLRRGGRRRHRRRRAACRGGRPADPGRRHGRHGRARPGRGDRSRARLLRRPRRALATRCWSVPAPATRSRASCRPAPSRP